METQKKILILSPQPFFIERGTPINVREIISALSQAGYDITLLAYPFGSEIEFHNLKIIRSFSVPGIKSIKAGPSRAKLILDIFFTLKALQLFMTKRFDLYHGIEEAGFIAGIIGLLKKRPFIVDVDSSMSEQLLESGFVQSKLILTYFKKLEGFFFKRASAVLTVCQALSEQVLRIEPLSKVTQIEDFPFIERNHQQHKFDLKKEFNIDQKKKLLIYAGNFEVYQGVELLINAFAKLIKDKNETSGQLVLVGGKSEQIDLLKQMVSNLGISNYLTFTGPLPAEMMPEIHEQADVLLSPRITGSNTPLKIYNYMAAERIIVATRILSHTQVLNEQNCLLADPEPEDLAEKLISAINDDFLAVAHRQQLIANARHLVNTKYSRQRFHREIQKLYQKLLS